MSYYDKRTMSPPSKTGDPAHHVHPEGTVASIKCRNSPVPTETPTRLPTGPGFLRELPCTSVGGGDPSLNMSDQSVTCERTGVSGANRLHIREFHSAG